MSTSDSSRNRESKRPQRADRTPMFELREDALPPPPQPLRHTRDPFGELADQPHPKGRPPVAAAARPRAPRLLADDGDADRFVQPSVRPPIAESSANLRKAQVLARAYHADRAPVMVALPSRQSLWPIRGPWLLALVSVVCLAVIWLALTPPQTVISRFGGALTGAPRAQKFAVAAAPAGQHSVIGGPTIDAAMIDTVLAKYGSPAAGTGHVWVELGQQYGIDPAYALAFFIHESGAGTNPQWAGIKPGGSTTHNVGNIICAGYDTCFGRFRDYASWEEGIEDWYKLIAVEYIAGRGIQTLEQIIPIYAPASDNNYPAGYIQAVATMVEAWRRGVMP